MADTFVSITGNLTDDPELRHTASGVPVANFRVAVTPRVKDGDGWKDGETSFYRVAAWRQLAENVTESLPKGARVMVTGQLRVNTWETPEGDKRSTTEIVADEVGPSLKWATAKPQRGNREGEPLVKGKGEFNDNPPF